LAACVLAVLASSAYAIDPNRAMSQYVRDRWGAEQGFPRGPVYAIAQTADGYLWIGTEAGLVRFDGLNFRLIRDESAAFTIRRVLGLSADNDGCLWLRLEDLTILRYCNGAFESHPTGQEAYTDVSAMGRAIHGDTLSWRMDHGLFDLHGGKFKMLVSDADLPRSPVTSLAQTPNGDMWMGTRDAGVFRQSGGVTWAIRAGLPDLKVNCLLADGDRDLWIGTDDGMVRWNGSELTEAGIPPSLNHLQALAMARDRDGNIWVGTDSKGLLRFNSQGIATLKENYGVSGEAVTAVFEDREGNLWIGSAGGLERLRDSTFVTYSLPEGLPTDGSNPVFVDAETRVWFGDVGSGLLWLKDGRHGRVNDAGLDKDVVYSIAGQGNEVWLGRQRGGLTLLRPAGDSFRATTYTTADGLLSNTVNAILETSDGTMCFATPSGVTALSTGGWQSWARKDGLPSDDVNCLLEDSQGVLWIGTSAGLAFRDSGWFRSPASVPATLHEQVLGLAEDSYGWLWMATSGHVLRVKRDKLVRGPLAAGDFREYGLADGLRGVEGVKRFESVVKDPHGRIWFSLNRGISSVDPARITSSSVPAMVHVQTISADNDTIGLRESIHIPGGRQRIVFGFTGLSLASPERFFSAIGLTDSIMAGASPWRHGKRSTPICRRAHIDSGSWPATPTVSGAAARRRSGCGSIRCSGKPGGSG
jgi:ligand-binding sensor domain-containing protein